MKYEEVQKACGLFSDDLFAELPIAPGSERRTGRTTRIIVRALAEHVSQGRRVIMVCADKHQADYIGQVARRLVKAAGFDPVLFSTVEVELHLRRLPGRQPEAVTYDHRVDARRFQA